MDKGSESRANNREYSILSFHHRFDIDIGLGTAQQQFINRVLNALDSDFPQLEDYGEDSYDYTHWVGINSYVANKLGKRYDIYSFTEYAARGSFLEFLKALEALYEAFDELHMGDRLRMLSEIIESALETSEIDLGVDWQAGIFLRSGAKLLDEALVNDNLRWLSDSKYISVREPFKKGLGHLMDAKTKPERLNNTITEMYKAFEALAKVVVGNDRDLSANREAFIDKINLSDYYKRMLKDYITYANKFSRHAPGPGKTKTRLLPSEVEAFVYITGLFIRLSVKQLAIP